MIAYEGETCSVYEQFLDDWDEPILPDGKPPAVRLYDSDKSVLCEVTAMPDGKEPGLWRADLPIPHMNLRNPINLYARWRMVTSEGTFTGKTPVEVKPATEGRDTDIVIVCGHDTRMQLVLPFAYKVGAAAIPGSAGKPATPAIPGDSLTFSLYFNNKAVFENFNANDNTVKVKDIGGRTEVDMPAVVGQAAMAPLSLLVRHRPAGLITDMVYTYKVWAVTPQILLAERELNDFIDKARIANIIPELEYNTPELLEWLSRGLSYFNGLQPTLTNFTGTNMQGHLLDAWLTCSAYYALRSQIQAEGALGFDFGGQTVSLNVDRTPAIEGEIGRLESQIENSVKPLKKLLAKAGVIAGDGSAGGQFIDGSRALGLLSLTNSPTTRVAPGRGGRQGWFRNYF